MNDHVIKWIKLQPLLGLITSQYVNYMHVFYLTVCTYNNYDPLVLTEIHCSNRDTFNSGTFTGSNINSVCMICK